MTDVVDLDHLELDEAKIRQDISDALEAADTLPRNVRREIADVIVTDMPHRVHSWFVVTEDDDYFGHTVAYAVQKLTDLFDGEQLHEVYDEIKQTLVEWGELPAEEPAATSPEAPQESALLPIPLSVEVAFTF
jgi:hypothetical protein